MTLQERHFTGQASEPIYTPAGFSVAAPLPPIKVKHHPLSIGACIVGIAFCALLAGYAMTSAWNVYAAHLDHQRACALPVHSNPSCGE